MRNPGEFHGGHEEQRHGWALNVNGFGTRGENVKKHGIWGRNSHLNWCPYFCCYINV